MPGRLRARTASLVVLLAAASVGLVNVPAEAAPGSELKRAAKSMVVPSHVTTRVVGRDVTVAWRLPSVAARKAVDRFEVRYRQDGQTRWSRPVSTTKRTLQVEDLTGGRRAAFSVRAREGSRTSAWSRGATALPVSSPGRVRGLIANTPSSTVRLTWAPPSRNGGRKVERYEVMYRVTGSGFWRHIHREVGRATIDGLSNAKRYSFRVRAKNAVGAGAWTAVLRARPGTIEPKASTSSAALQEAPVAIAPVVVEGSDAVQERTSTPAAESAVQSAPDRPATPSSAAVGTPASLRTSPGRGAVALAWAAPAGSGGTVDYEVRVRTEPSGTWGPSTRVTSTSAAVEGLRDGTAYGFSVRAADPVVGAWSDPVESTPGTPTATVAPAVRFADRALRIDTTWSDAEIDDNGSPVAGWQVRYRAVGESSWTVEAVADPAARTLRLSSMSGGFKRQFAVRATNSSGGGAWSSEAALYVPVLTLPVLSVDTADAAPVLSKDDYVAGSYDLDPNGARDSAGTSYTSASGGVDVKGRGNSTWTNPKKPYRLKLSAKTELLGMPANKNWVLLADYYDHSLLRNETALYLGGRTGLAWTPRTRFVEVLLNGDYLGLYQLAEQVRIDPGRIDIKSMKATDTAGNVLTGGYQLERDGRWNPAEEAGFTSSMGQPIVVKDPEVPSPEQAAYIKQYVNAFETALRSPDRGDAAKGYAAYIDVDSFVDWYIVEELVQNVDANFASMNLYKPRGGRLTMGPLWDFDLAFENAGRLYAKREAWWVKNESWWPEFFKDPGWEARVEARWHVLRRSMGDVQSHVTETQTQIATAAVGNSERWGPWGDFDGQVQMMHDFLTVRTNWLDAQWGVE